MNILRYKQIKTKFKNNHIIGLDGYPHYILEVMKLPKKYIAETWKNRNFKETSGKEQTRLVFLQIQEKGTNEQINRKG